MKKANSVPSSYRSDYADSLIRMSQRDERDFINTYGKSTVDDFVEDMEYNLQNESINEAKMTPAKVQKTQRELVATIDLLKKNFPMYKKAKESGDDKKLAKHRDIAIKLTKKKKQLEKALDAALGGLYQDAELELKETVYDDVAKSIPDNYSYKDLAHVVANIIKNEYGSHNIKPFMREIGRALKEGKLNEKVKFKDRSYDYQLDYVANDLFNKDYRRLNSKQKDKVEYELDGYMEESINEKLSLATAKRMDGLHNLKAMKQVIVGAKIIKKDLYDEGFENYEILEFLMDRIRRAAF